MAWRTGAADNDADLDERGRSGHAERPPAGAANVLSESNHPAGFQRRSAISSTDKVRHGRSNGRSGTRLAKGGWMPKIPIAAAAKKAWIVLVVVAVVAVAGYVQGRGTLLVLDLRRVRFRSRSAASQMLRPYGPRSAVRALMLPRPDGPDSGSGDTDRLPVSAPHY
jgi:hypothetical protein